MVADQYDGDEYGPRMLAIRATPYGKTGRLRIDGKCSALGNVTIIDPHQVYCSPEEALQRYQITANIDVVSSRRKLAQAEIRLVAANKLEASSIKRSLTLANHSAQPR